MFGDLPAAKVEDMRADDPPDAGDVEPGCVRRQLTLQLRHPQVEVLAEHLQQGRVEPRFVLVEGEPEASSHA